MLKKLKTNITTLNVTISIILASCSPIERHARLVSKFPYVHKSDTLTIHDTIRIEKSQKDTVFYYNQKDTVIVREGRLTMKYFYNNTDSTVYLKGTCKDSLIFRTLKIPMYKNNEVLYMWTKFKNWIIIASLLLALVIISRTILKIYGK